MIFSLSIGLVAWSSMVGFWFLMFKHVIEPRCALLCPDCGSTVYFAEDMGQCRFGLLDSSCSMGEWDESFVDGLSFP